MISNPSNNTIALLKKCLTPPPKKNGPPQKKRKKYIHIFIYIYIVLVLLSTLVERFSVSRMKDKLTEVVSLMNELKEKRRRKKSRTWETSIS